MNLDQKLSFLKDSRINSSISVIISAYLLASSYHIFLDGGFAWSVYAVVVTVFVFVPVMVYRNLEKMPPFEILLLLAVPLTVKALELGFVASHTLNYVSVAAVALLIFTELDAHTSFDTSARFGAFLIMIFTIALAGFWAVGRWIFSLYFSTPFDATNDTLMWEFAAATVAGAVSGKFLGPYMKKRETELMVHED